MSRSRDSGRSYTVKCSPGSLLLGSCQTSYDSLGYLDSRGGCFGFVHGGREDPDHKKEQGVHRAAVGKAFR